MARRQRGQIIEPRDGRGWAIRFRAYGKRRLVTLGTSEEGWTREKAEEGLRHVLADVERGIWQPYEPAKAPVDGEAPTFREFALEWLAAREPELRPRTVEDYEWALSHHLLPFFKDHRLSWITAEEVDRYKAAKLREGKLSPNSINKTLARLSQVLEVAVEYGHIERNPAKGRRRRVKGTEPRRSWVEPEQLPALLDAADAYMRPLIAVLAGGGLRIGEAVALDWRDVSLGAGTLIVRESKTTAGEGREVDLPVGLREELATWRARCADTGPDDPVFVTRERRGRRARQTRRNAHARLSTVVEAANRRLAESRIEPIDGVSPHSLRRTYASLRAALRDDPTYIAEQLGHRNPGFTFRVYQRAAKRREKLTGAHLAAFDRALEWATMGSGTHLDATLMVPAAPGGVIETASQSRKSGPTPA